MKFRLKIIALLFAILFAAAARADFTLDEYNRWQQYNGWPVRVVSFPGIKALTRAELFKVISLDKPTWLRRYIRAGFRPTFYADNFCSDIIRLQNHYAREGFPKAGVKGVVEPDEKQQELVVKFEVSEGLPVILDSWQMIMGSDSGAGVDSARWSDLLPIKIGKRIALSDIKVAEDTLRYKLTEIGHARARVESQLAIDSMRSTANLTFILYPGHFCWLGESYFSGLKQVRETTARKEISFQIFSPFSPQKLSKTRKNLVRLETFNFVSVEADTSEKTDTLKTYIRLREGNRYRLRYGLGYNTIKGIETDLEFTDLNFLGGGRRLTLTSELAEIERGIGLRFFQPHLPFQVTDLTVSPKWKIEFEPSFVLETQSVTTIFSANPLEFVSTSLSNEFGIEHRRDFDTTGFNRPDSISNYTKSVETFSVGWDTRDNLLNARKGHFLGFTLAESGALWRVDNRWWRVVLQGKSLYPANKVTVLAGKAEFGAMGPLYTSAETPIQERFYIGGPSSVRGWGRKMLSPRAQEDRKKTIGGDVEFQMTAEVRRDIWGPVIGVIFLDAGNVWTQIEDLKKFDLFPSAGAGIGFQTPIGPIRVDFGYQLKKNPYGDLPWALHFSLGSPF